MKKKTIKLQLHTTSKLHLICLDSPEDIDGFTEENDITLPEGMTSPEGLFWKHGNDFHIIFHRGSSHGDIAHEVVHFLNTFYKAINQKLDDENDEIYAHLLSHFTDKAIKLQLK